MLLVHAELEVVLLPALAGGSQPPLAVNEHGDVRGRDVVDDVEPDPPVVDAVRAPPPWSAGGSRH